MGFRNKINTELASGMRDIHTVREWLDLNDLVTATRIIAEVVRLGGAPERAPGLGGPPGLAGLPGIDPTCVLPPGLGGLGGLGTLLIYINPKYF